MAACLTEQVLDAVVPTVVTVTDEGVNGLFRVVEVATTRVRTGIATRVEGFLATAAAFQLGVGG